ncbi:sulfotransferase family protein [Methylocystis parvus]|uniref:Sulfotransferase n=1 Tax=Methylocystis parvus TaxID=134 RepID=A0A6B8MDX5_9HYPH|nr:sulfotransferase [Methylocystis parvus]QGM98830.1 sulfotransferase [Methylocystis parvus]WBK00820.1 sulfotransferase [Methylocystis parvus OBBP]
MGDSLPGPGLSSYPIFIFGSPRSATSLLSECVRRLGWGGFDEGHMFDLLALQRSVIDQHYTSYRHDSERSAWAPESFPYEPLKAGLVAFFEQFMVGRFGPNWHDKTPGESTLCHAREIKKLFPNARFIFCKRRSVDVIASATRRFANNSVAIRESCDLWVSVMMYWAEIRSDLGVSGIEIDQHDIVADPLATGRRLAAFLSLPDDHGEKLAEMFRTIAPEQTKSDPTPIPLSQTEFSEEDKAYIVERTAHCMTLFGYGFETPFVEASSFRPVPFSIDPRVVDLSGLKDRSLYMHTGPRRFLLHPSNPGELESTVRFLCRPTHGAKFVRTVLTVENVKSGEVVGKLALRSGAETVSEIEGVSSWGVPCELVVAIPEELNMIEILLSTKMASSAPNNAYAWANFVDLSFL